MDEETKEEVIVEEVKDINTVTVSERSAGSEKKPEQKKETDKTWWPITLSIIASVFALFGSPCFLVSVAGLVLSAIALSMLMKKNNKCEYAHRSVAFALSVFAVTLSSMCIIFGFVLAICLNSLLDNIHYYLRVMSLMRHHF